MLYVRTMIYLAVGDVRRPGIGRAMKSLVVLGIAFTLLAWSSKELRALYEASPWADDPYDAFVSFAIFFAPALTALLLVRLPLCKANESLAAGRVVDLVRTGKVLLAVVTVTLGAEWVALALNGATIDWSVASALDVLMLTLLTALTILCAWLVVTLPQLDAGRSPDTPDGLADALATARLVAAALGPFAWLSNRAISAADSLVAQPARRHPTTAAALVSTLFGMALAAAASSEEGVGPILLVFVVAGTAAMFCFLMIGGALSAPCLGSPTAYRLASAHPRRPRRGRWCRAPGARISRCDLVRGRH